MRRFIRHGRSPQLTHKEHHLSRALFSSTFFPSICRLLLVPNNAKKALTIIGAFSIWIDGVNFTLRVDLSTASLFSSFFFPRFCAGQWNILTETKVLSIVYIYKDFIKNFLELFRYETAGIKRHCCARNVFWNKIFCF